MNDRKDGRLEKGKLTRQKILSSAFTLLVEEGPRGITAGKLAAKAQVSKANLFHHFPKIDDVPFALLEEFLGQFSAITYEKKPRSVSELVAFIGKSVLEAPDAHKKIIAASVHFYLRSAHDDAFRAIQERMTKRVVQIFQNTFEEILKRPLTVRERETAPILLAMSMEGLSLYSIVFNDKTQLKKAWTSFSILLNEYLEGGNVQ